MVVLNCSAGWEVIRKDLLSKGFKFLSVFELNKGRHLLIHTDKENFYCLFKHEFFHSFNYIFKDFIGKNPEFKGFGESINVSCLEVATKYEATLLYVYEDESVYSIPSLLVKKFCDLHNLFRVQDKSNIYKLGNFSREETSVRENEVVFPVKLLNRFGGC
jgi:hypothetical protein